MRTKTVFFILVISLTFAVRISAQEVVTNRIPAPPLNTNRENVTQENFFYDIPAQFPGGYEAMQQFIMQHLEYPDDGMVCVTGRVVLRFKVGKSGKVSDITVTKSLHPKFDKAAIKVVKKFPRFQPARLKDKKVPMWFTLPIKFEIY